MVCYIETTKYLTAPLGKCDACQIKDAQFVKVVNDYPLCSICDLCRDHEVYMEEQRQAHNTFRDIFAEIVATRFVAY